MSPFDPKIDNGFREYAALQLRRHGLLMSAGGPETEVDEIEDRMTKLWEEFDERQRQSANGMGSDLNWIRRKGNLPPQGRKAEEVTPNERQELLTALKTAERHAFLHYLRICASTMFSVNLAYHRGNTYDAIGFPEYASAFHEFAAELDPTNPPLGVNALLAVDRVDPEKALRSAAQIIASPFQFPPVVVALGAVILLRRDEKDHRTIDRDRYSAVLSEAVARLVIEPPSVSGQIGIYQLAAEGFWILNDAPAALRCYEEALKLSPDDEVPLIGKGILLYGSDPEKAAEVFRRVVSKEESRLVWPYFFLAHYSLLHKNYSDSLKIGKQALERATTFPVRAELLQWQAICLSAEGSSPEVVRPVFAMALSIDPSNERIRKNLKAFEESLADKRATSWDIESEETLRRERSPQPRELYRAA